MSVEMARDHSQDHVHPHPPHNPHHHHSHQSRTKPRWDRESVSLRNVVNTSHLPVSVKVHRGDVEKYLPVTAVDPKHQNIVLRITEVCHRKTILGRRMHWDRRVGDYVPHGTQIEIPATFKGWFEILPDDGRPVEYFDTIHGITSVKPQRFLVRTSTVGYQLTVEEGGSSWTPCEVRAGEVLTTGIVYMDQKRSKVTNMKSLLKKFLKPTKLLGRKDQELRYLQCFDIEGKEVMIPLIMSGVFSPIGDATETNYDAVYDLNDMLLAFPLPVKTQLVHGESTNTQSVPHGVIKIEGSKEEDVVVVSLVSAISSGDEVFELPVDNDLKFWKEASKVRHKIPTQINPVLLSDVKLSEKEYATPHKPVTLPTKSRETKKSVGAALLEKFSQRKTRKERVGLKAAQQEGVFSSRLSRIDLNYDDFFKVDDEEGQENQTDIRISNPENSIYENTRAETKISYVNLHTPLELKPSDEQPMIEYATVNKPLPTKEAEEVTPEDGRVSQPVKPMQDRVLPPIPNPDADNDSNSDMDDSTETLYEKLPPAPEIPPAYASPSSIHVDLGLTSSIHVDLGLNEIEITQDILNGVEKDGYMIPAEVKESEPIEFDGDVYDDFTSYRKRAKPPVAPGVRKARSYGGSIGRSFAGNIQSYDIDEMFDFSSALNISGDGAFAKQERGSISSGSESRAPTQRRHRRQKENIGQINGFQKSLSQRCLNTNSRLAISPTDDHDPMRSRNFPREPSAIEIFNFNDSFHNVQPQDMSSPIDPSRVRHSSSNNRCSPPYDDEEEDDIMMPAGDGGIPINYAHSEPGYRHYSRSYSVTGLSDTYIKNGDDSAISMCSRGDYGFPMGSEYSYADYMDRNDDGYVPPDNISELTVPEVSKSLRYIGMKDRVVLRFSQEQIDGSMLTSLDKKLLHEGFPELNALEIKKIIDFVEGWRPKKQ